jgi:hypothetical protein
LEVVSGSRWVACRWVAWGANQSPNPAPADDAPAAGGSAALKEASEPPRPLSNWPNADEGAAAATGKGAANGSASEGRGGVGGLATPLLLATLPQASSQPRPLSNKLCAVLPAAAPGPAPAAGEAAGEPLVFAGDGGTRALSLSPGLAPGGTTIAAVRPVSSSVGKSTESPGLQPSGTTTQRTCSARNRTFFKKLLF